jgi:hypothetical protein
MQNEWDEYEQNMESFSDELNGSAFFAMGLIALGFIAVVGFLFY